MKACISPSSSPVTLYNLGFTLFTQMISPRPGTLALVSVLLSAPLGALAALYPTLPNQGTVIEGGKDTIIRWKNDGNSPHLNELGPLRVDLFVGDDHHLVTTLATDINPNDRAATIRIEPYLGADGSDYYIRFTPPVFSPIYTGRFTLAGMTGANYYAHTDASSNNQASGPQAELYDESGNSLSTKNANSDDNSEAELLGEGGAGASADSTTTSLEPSSGAFSITSSSGTTFGSSITSSYSFSSTSRAVAVPTPTSAAPASVQSGTTSSANGGAARYHRSRESDGISSAGMLYLMWPVLMGAIMAI